jgi:phi13 family phage major tail protein|nr:MAG TPA: tail tube protein [Caudoviricetes sp.]
MPEKNNKILYGIEKCYVALLTETEEGITYGEPFAVKGARGLNMDPQGDLTKIYADNIVYFKANSNQGYEGDLVLLITPEEFLTQILGQTKDKNGAIFENADDKIARFALMFEGKGDEKARRWVFYDCTATRPSRENNTQEESIEAGEETMTITMSPRTTDKMVKCYMEPSETNQELYNSFFTKVYEKDAEAGV